MTTDTTTPSAKPAATKSVLKLQSLRADIQRQNDGDWVDVPGYPGIRLKVRALSYTPYQNALQKLIERVNAEAKKALKVGRSYDKVEAMDRGNGLLLATMILQDWDGFDTAYSPEVTAELLPEPEWRELRTMVVGAASILGQVEGEWEEQAVGNSAAPSATA
ncbi:MAG: hypothetical protein KBC46_03490 [Ferrovibrio sp.]|nr:hypothetical protein [Ferrovibrio sp.]